MSSGIDWGGLMISVFRMVPSNHSQHILILLMLEAICITSILVYIEHFGNVSQQIPDNIGTHMKQVEYNVTSKTVNLYLEHNTTHKYGMDYDYNKSVMKVLHGKCMDPDNWQTVEQNISYVHSAHLHLESNDTVSVIQHYRSIKKTGMVS